MDVLPQADREKQHEESLKLGLSRAVGHGGLSISLIGLLSSWQGRDEAEGERRVRSGNATVPVAKKHLWI